LAKEESAFLYFSKTFSTLNQALAGHIPATFNSELENLFTELDVLDDEMEIIIEMADQIDTLKQTLTPDIVTKMQQTTNMLSEIAIENLQRQATNKEEIDLTPFLRGLGLLYKIQCPQLCFY